MSPGVIFDLISQTLENSPDNSHFLLVSPMFRLNIVYSLFYSSPKFTNWTLAKYSDRYKIYKGKKILDFFCSSLPNSDYQGMRWDGIFSYDNNLSRDFLSGRLSRNTVLNSFLYSFDSEEYVIDFAAKDS